MFPRSFKLLLLSGVSFLTFGGSVSAQNFEDTTSSIYVQDLANDALVLPKILSCILNQAGVGASDQLTNASWAALVNEKTCDLVDNDGSYAKAVLKSSRASATSPQEVQGWMDTSLGEKILMTASISQAPTQTDPYGRFNVSFYRVNPDDGDTLITSEELTEITDPVMYGYAYIYEESDDIVLDAVLKDTALEGDMLIRSRAVAVGGDTDNIRYALEWDNAWRALKAVGTTNASKSFRYLLDHDTSEVIGAECTSRTTAWQNTWEMGLFDDASGARVNLEFPSLSFNTADGYYGDVNADWLWIDGAERENLYPLNNKMSVAPMDGSEDKELIWTPGVLKEVVSAPYEPSDGDTVEYWDGGKKYSAEFNETSGKFEYVDNGTTKTVPSYRQVWSPMRRMDVVITEDNAGIQKFTGKRRETALPSKSSNLFFENGVERTVVNPAKLYCVGWGCLDKNLNLDETEMASLIISEADQNGLPWDAFRTEQGRSRDSVYTYFLAPLSVEPSSGLVAGALYYDVDASGTLTTSDEPLFFDFRGDWNDKEYTNWDGSEATNLNTALVGKELHFNLGFKLVDSTCDLSQGQSKFDAYNSCDAIHYEAHPRSGGYAYVKNADGSYYNFSKPIALKLENFSPADHDRNVGYADNALANGYLPEMGTVLDGYWNPITNQNCDVATWDQEFADAYMEGNLLPFSLTATIEGASYCLVPVAPDYFTGQDLYFQYDGRVLHGANGVGNDVTDRFYQTVNLKTGTKLVDMSDPNKVYKVKPLFIDEYMQSITGELEVIGAGPIQAALQACNDEGLAFELTGANSSDVMVDLLNNLPPAWFNEKYVKPGLNWDDKPVVSRGDNCFVKDLQVTCP